MGCGSAKAKEVNTPEKKPYEPAKPAPDPASSKPPAAKPAPPSAAPQPPVTAVINPPSSSSFVQNKLGPIDEDYQIGETLGRGAFAEVKKAIFKPTNDPRAIKIVHKLGLDLESLDQKHKLREIKVLKELDHPNILRVHQLYEDKNRYYIVMEFCAGGDLFTKLQDVRKFTEVQVGKLMFQLLSAISYCHQRWVIHRDLKPENLLLEDSGSEMTIKIADFGSSSFIDPKKKLSGVHGSAYYVAPEVLKEAYNEKCDIWSCGIIMYILLTGKPPYAGRTEKDILTAVYAGSLDVSALNSVSADARDLVNQLLNRNYRFRPSAAEALNHGFIQRCRTADPAFGPTLSTAMTNLKAFNNASKLKDAIYTFMATQVITQADLKDLRESFQSLDKNGDGRISREELLEKYRTTMPTATAEQEVAEIMSQVDTNKSGYIDYTEFLRASMNKSKHLSQKNLETTFRIFDKDGSGKISADELRTMIEGTSVGEGEGWGEIIKDVDQNGDGEIDLREFEALLLKRL